MYIRVNGIRLYYETAGKGPAMIMLHGNGEDHAIFNEAVSLLKEHFTVYLPDSRDHGNSDRVSKLHYQDMALDMLDFMEQLDLRDVTFYGFSDGGIIGLLAAMKTDRISKLIVSGANLTPRGLRLPVRLAMRLQYLFSRDQKLKLMLEEPEINSNDLTEIKADTVVIAGGHDVIREKETRMIAEGIPKATMMILPEETHDSYIIHSRKIAEIILSEVNR